MTGAGQIIQNVFGTSIVRNLLNQHRYNVIIKKKYTSITAMVLASFSDNGMKIENELVDWEKNKEANL